MRQQLIVQRVMEDARVASPYLGYLFNLNNADLERWRRRNIPKLHLDRFRNNVNLGLKQE